MAISGSACAKFILLGEHAVVYGQPAIACPVQDLRATVNISSSSAGIKITSQSTEEEYKLLDLANPPENPLALTVYHTLNWLKLPLSACNLTIKSKIPIACGMGSGTAVTLAQIRALTHHLKQNLSAEEENLLADRIETVYHGQPSGIDSKVITFEKNLYFQKGNQPSFFNLNCPFHFLLADSGDTHNTREVVSGVRERYQKESTQYQAMFEYIGILVQQGYHALQSGDYQSLGHVMTDNHDILKKIGVSNERLDHLVTSALKAGALGAKLSGAGQGGICIALVMEENKIAIAKALKEAGAKQVYDIVLKK